MVGAIIEKMHTFIEKVPSTYQTHWNYFTINREISLLSIFCIIFRKKKKLKINTIIQLYAPRTWPRTPICFMTSEARRSAPIKAHIGALAYNIIALLFIWLSQNILTCWDDFFCGHVHHTVEDFWWYCLLPQTHEWVCNRGQSYDFFIVCFFFFFQLHARYKNYAILVDNSEKKRHNKGKESLCENVKFRRKWVK